MENIMIGVNTVAYGMLVARVVIHVVEIEFLFLNQALAPCTTVFFHGLNLSLFHLRPGEFHRLFLSFSSQVLSLHGAVAREGKEKGARRRL